jgi:hypothetical protein
VVEVYEEILASHKYVIGKRRVFLIAFQRIMDIICHYTKTQKS